MKKKKNIYVYFLKMVVFFLIFLIIQQILSGITLMSLKNERYGNEALFEIIWAGFVLLLLLLYKNRYIFSQKRESFAKGFKYIIPEVVLSTIFLTISIVTLATSSMPINVFSILNLFILCIFVGIVEEFLCRGWLLNEFLERYSNNRKEIILSIIFSSFVFGVIHFFNLGAGQNFLETTIQVLNAGVSGIFLALVYYKTKNIWLVVFSHFYWDFSLMLLQHNQLVDCYSSNNVSTAVVLASIISGIIIVIGYLIFCYWMYRQTDLYTKKVKSKKNYLIVIGTIVYLFGLFAQGIILDNDDGQICPVYEDKKISSEYKLIYNNYSKYQIIENRNNNQYKFELRSNKDDKVLFDNVDTEQSVTLTDEYYDYLLADNEESFSILIQVDYNKVLYGNYLKKDISNADSYLEEIKNGLKEYHVPEINKIYVMNVKDNYYNYIVIDTAVNKEMIFDDESRLYFIDFE